MVKQNRRSVPVVVHGNCVEKLTAKMILRLVERQEDEAAVRRTGKVDAGGALTATLLDEGGAAEEKHDGGREGGRTRNKERTTTEKAERKGERRGTNKYQESTTSLTTAESPEAVADAERVGLRAVISRRQHRRSTITAAAEAACVNAPRRVMELLTPFWTAVLRGEWDHDESAEYGVSDDDEDQDYDALDVCFLYLCAAMEDAVENEGLGSFAQGDALTLVFTHLVQIKKLFWRGMDQNRVLQLEQQLRM